MKKDGGPILEFEALGISGKIENMGEFFSMKFNKSGEIDHESIKCIPYEEAVNFSKKLKSSYVAKVSNEAEAANKGEKSII